MSKKLILGLLGMLLLSGCAGPGTGPQLAVEDPATTVTLFMPPT